MKLMTAAVLTLFGCGLIQPALADDPGARTPSVPNRTTRVDKAHVRGLSGAGIRIGVFEPEDGRAKTTNPQIATNPYLGATFTSRRRTPTPA